MFRGPVSPVMGERARSSSPGDVRSSGQRLRRAAAGEGRPGRRVRPGPARPRLPGRRVLRLGPPEGRPPDGPGGDRDCAADRHPQPGAVPADRGRPHRRRGARPRPGRARRPAGRAVGGAPGEAAAPAGRPAARGRPDLPGGRGAGRVRRPLLGDLAPVRLPGRRPPGRGGPAAARPRALARPPARHRPDERRREAAARRARLRRVLQEARGRHHHPHPAGAALGPRPGG